MKVKKYTVTDSDLNSLPYIEIDLSFLDTKDNHIYFPKGLKYINSTNATIEFLYVANDIEKAETLTIPTWYEYLEVPTGNTTVDIPKTQYLRIKNTNGVAIADLTIFAFNFSTWQR